MYSLTALESSAGMIQRSVEGLAHDDSGGYRIPWYGEAADRAADAAGAGAGTAGLRNSGDASSWADPGLSDTLQSEVSSTLHAGMPSDGLHVQPVQYPSPDDSTPRGQWTPMPLAAHSVDAVLANCSLHWVNDVPGMLTDVLRVLKPDGLFIAAVPGGETLEELRQAITVADLERRGGVTPRVSPMMHMADAGALLQGAGFSLITVDIDTVAAGYASPAVLMEHLQRAGENNAVDAAHGGMSYDVMLAAAAAYHALSPAPSTEAGEAAVVASAQVIFMIGWAPAASQPQPKARGSATHTLKEIGHITSDSVE